MHIREYILRVLYIAKLILLNNPYQAPNVINFALSSKRANRPSHVACISSVSDLNGGPFNSNWKLTSAELSCQLARVY